MMWTNGQNSSNKIKTHIKNLQPTPFLRLYLKTELTLKAQISKTDFTSFTSDINRMKL